MESEGFLCPSAKRWAWPTGGISVILDGRKEGRREGRERKGKEGREGRDEGNTARTKVIAGPKVRREG